MHERIKASKADYNAVLVDVVYFPAFIQKKFFTMMNPEDKFEPYIFYRLMTLHKGLLFWKHSSSLAKHVILLSPYSHLLTSKLWRIFFLKPHAWPRFSCRVTFIPTLTTIYAFVIHTFTKSFPGSNTSSFNPASREKG